MNHAPTNRLLAECCLYYFFIPLSFYFLHNRIPFITDTISISPKIRWSGIPRFQNLREELNNQSNFHPGDLASTTGKFIHTLEVFVRQNASQTVYTVFQWKFIVKTGGRSFAGVNATAFPLRRSDGRVPGSSRPLLRPRLTATAFPFVPGIDSRQITEL